jgi:lysyl oxidase
MLRQPATSPHTVPLPRRRGKRAPLVAAGLIAATGAIVLPLLLPGNPGTAHRRRSRRVPPRRRPARWPRRRGWSDEYWWALPDQMIDVSSLTDSTYVLVTTVDPTNKLRELDETNNCVRIQVTLTGLATATPKAELGAQASHC